MKAKTLKPFEVILKKGIITIRVATIMAINNDEAIDKGLLLIMSENDLPNMTKWTAEAIKIR